MNLNLLVNKAVLFFQSISIFEIGIGVAVIFCIFAFFKPKAALKLAVAAVLLAAAAYLLSLVFEAMSVGVDKKGEMINRTRKQMD